MKRPESLKKKLNQDLQENKAVKKESPYPNLHPKKNQALWTCLNKIIKSWVNT